MSKRVEKIKEILAPAVNALGYELWGVEYLAQGKHSVLRIFIDSPDGISIDDCAEVSHQVSGILDVEDPLEGEYILEVSSPGMDRPLFELEQFEGYKSEQIQVNLTTKIEGRRKFTGKLIGVQGQMLVFEVDADVLSVPFDLVQKAQLVPQFDS